MRHRKVWAVGCARWRSRAVSGSVRFTCAPQAAALVYEAGLGTLRGYLHATANVFLLSYTLGHQAAWVRKVPQAGVMPSAALQHGCFFYQDTGN